MTKQTAARKSGTTTLTLGLVKAPIALYKATGKGAGDPKFLKAGPNGLPLETAAAQNGKRHVAAVATDVAGSRTGTTADVVIDSATDTHVGEIVPDAPEDAVVEAPITSEVFEKGQDVALDPEQIREGVRVGEKETFVDLSDQLAFVRQTTVLDDMQVVGFIRREQVPRYRVTDTYFVGADADAGGRPETLALLLHGMKQTGRVAVVKWSKSSRQAMGAIVPAADGALTLLQLTFADETRAAPARALTHTTVDVTEGEVNAMVELIGALATKGSESLDTVVDDRKLQEKQLVALAEADAVSDFDMTEAEDLAVPDLPLIDLVKRTTADVRSA